VKSYTLLQGQQLLKLSKTFPRAMVSLIFSYQMQIIHFFAGTGAFLRDPSICGNLEGFCIWVGFNFTYERGSYSKRTGYTPQTGRFNDCADNEIVVVVSDHRTGQHLPRKVQLHHLVPASPIKKGDYVLLLSGENQGHVTEVV
jgi:hypothetical protein